MAAKGGKTPILVLVDTQGQLMARRDEMRGLNGYSCASGQVPAAGKPPGASDHRAGIRQGGRGRGFGDGAGDRPPGRASSDGTYSDRSAVSVAGHETAPGHSEAAREDDAGLCTGLDHLLQMAIGTVAEIWDPKRSLDDQLEEALRNTSPVDTRDELGAQREGSEHGGGGGEAGHRSGERAEAMPDTIAIHPWERCWQRHELLTVAPSFWRSQPAVAVAPFLGGLGGQRMASDRASTEGRR